MRYKIFVTDFDGTLADHGRVGGEAFDSLARLKATSRILVLITGRELGDLKAVFHEYKSFDYIVAENGALIYDVDTGIEEPLGPPPSNEFVDALKEAGISPMSVGRIIIATWEPHDKKVLELIKKFGIERQLIFNKGAVMVLPPGINKATGLETLLKNLNLSPHNTVAVGDAENDSALLQIAECSCAVSNALPAVKEVADSSLPGENGKGIVDLINRIVDTDLSDVPLERHKLTLGTKSNGDVFSISPYRTPILLTGTSGGGKSTFTVSIAEALIERQYQFCLIDPEGDYQDLRDVIILGNENAVPSLEELETILTNPENCLAICTLAIPLADRPEFFSRLLQTLLKLRNELGHPHWVLMDEAHHFLTGESALRISQDEFNNFLLITNSPESLNTDLLKILGMAIVVGENPIRQLEYIGGIRKMKYPASPVLSTGEAYVWNFENELENGVITLRSPGQFLLRHKKKYAHGDLNEKSFYFTGGENRLNLRATNLMTFANLAEGIDDDTWDYHLGRKDFFNWFKTAVNDDELAEVSEKARRNPTASKKMILDFIKKKYTG